MGNQNYLCINIRFVAKRNIENHFQINFKLAFRYFLSHFKQIQGTLPGFLFVKISFRLYFTQCIYSMSSVTIYFYLFFFKVALKQRKTPYTIKLAPQKYNAGSSLLPAIRLSNKKCIHSAIKIIKMLLQFQKLRFNNCVNPRYKSVISFI